MCETATDEGGLPAGGAAKRFKGCTLTVFLKQPESNAPLRPIRCKACWFGFIEDADAFLYLVDYDRFGLVKLIV